MSKPERAVPGRTYRCLVCGAEVSVVRGGAGELAPRCCNQPMVLLPLRHEVYYCPVCGSEIMVLSSGGGELAPRCCNRPMIPRRLAA